MKYQGFLLATAGGVTAMSGAQAADLPVKAPRVLPPPPVASWTGWYVGAHAGVAWHQAGADYSGDVGETANAAALGPIVHSNTKAGFIGGGQIGYNWQLGMFLLGLEADISGLNAKVTAPTVHGKGNAFEGKINWLSTYRARAGFLARSDILIYATGGLAVGGVKDFFTSNGVGSSVALATTKSASKTKTGWTAGGGVEWMWARNWTVGLEGLYVDLGHTTGNMIATPTKTTRFNNTAAIGRVKLNYKF